MGGSVIAIGIGAQASGTTWLTAFLRKHSQVHYPREKEVHYFDRLEKLGLAGLIAALKAEESSPGNRPGPRRRAADRWSLRRRLQWQSWLRLPRHSAYCAYLRSGSSAAHRVIGEYTPAYATCSEETLRQIMGLGPDVRLIYLLRDPVAREWSSIRKSVVLRFGRDREAAAREIAALGDRLPEFASPGVLARSDYAETLARLARVARREQVLVMFHEELFSSRDTRVVTDFLGIDPMPGDFGAVINKGLDAGMSADLQSRLYARLKDQYKAVESHMGYLPQEWHQTMKEAA